MEASQPGRILLIDDDPALGGYLTRVLTRGGFEVTHELDSASALRRIEAQDWDLLITDIELPGMSGLELLERVRQLVPDLITKAAELVAGSDSHHCREIGRYDRWVLPALSAVGA